MTMGQIIEVLEMVWEEEKTLEMLENLTQNPTLDQAELYSTACEIAEKYKSETEQRGDFTQ